MYVYYLEKDEVGRRVKVNAISFESRNSIVEKKATVREVPSKPKVRKLLTIFLVTKSM